MTKPKLVDPTLGVKEPATEILKRLVKVRLPEGMASRTYAFYNGREKGISLVVTKTAGIAELVIVFGEARGSDRLFVDYWVNRGLSINAPTSDDEGYTDEVYRERKHFPPGKYRKAADEILRIVGAHFEGVGPSCRTLDRKSKV